jgi:hypothetical protein
MIVLWLTRRPKRTWLVWLLIAVAPAYTISRAFNIWSGRDIVEISKLTFGEDRAQSY